MARALVPIADGSEEMEAVIIIDVFRRAGWDVTVAGVPGGIVKASRGVKIEPDVNWTDVDPVDYDVIALPGGIGGTDVLMSVPSVIAAIQEHSSAGKIVAAVCAGPLILQEAGVLTDRKMTCHPSVGERIHASERVDASVVCDGNVITSQGPGTSFDFALAIVEMVEGSDKAERLAGPMVYKKGRPEIYVR